MWLATCHPNWIEKDDVEAEVDDDHAEDLLENLALPHLVLTHTSTTNVPVSKDIRPVRI